MKTSCLFLLACCLAFAGCGRKQNSPELKADSPLTAPATGTVTGAASAEAPKGSAPAAANGDQANPAQPLEGVVDTFLTSQLKIFVQEKGRLPETFAEFAGARLDSVPRLAKGLRFAIDPATQEVKIVKQ